MNFMLEIYRFDAQAALVALDSRLAPFVKED